MGFWRATRNASLRDMLNPGNGYHNDPLLGNDPQEGYGDYRNWSADSGKNRSPYFSLLSGISGLPLLQV